jgi:putative transposase
MRKSNTMRHGRHCVFNLHVHLVFVAKYRKAVFRKKHLDDMREIFSRVCADFEAVLVEIDGEKDHVHLLVNYVPKTSVSRLVNSLKGVSSRILKKKHTDLRRAYWKNALWSPSYFAASCGGAPIEIVKQYIDQQKTPL